LHATITDKIAKLTGDEPRSGYDELSAEDRLLPVAARRRQDSA
jgi:hypothetical protein